MSCESSTSGVSHARLSARGRGLVARRRRLVAALLTSWSLLVAPLVRAENVVIAVGVSTGANRTFNVNNPITYNFGVTADGAAAGLAAVQFNFTVDRGQTVTDPVIFTVYNGLGGTGTALASTSIAAANIPNGAFNSITGNLTTPLSLAAGVYSVKLTTATSGSGANNYTWKDGKLRLTNTSGSALTNYFYIEDNNSTGTASTTLNAATAVLASPNLATTTVAFGNFRLGSTLSSNVVLTNNNLATANNYSEALAGSATTTNGATVSGLPTVAAPLAQGAVATLTIGLPSATAGPVGGNVNFAFTSEKGTSVSPGPYGSAVGTPTIAVSGTGYREATAGFSTTSASLGKFHVGATNVTGTITLSNTQTAGQYSEGLAAASTATSGGASVVSGLPTVASPLAAGSNATLTLGLASVASVGTGNTGTVTLGLSTSGTGTSGLSAASIGSQVVNVSAQGYSGQSIWSQTTGGSWDSFANWDVPGGLPGVDGSLSVNDTATFGVGPTGTTTVSLNGANPQLASLSFTTSNAAYTIAAGSGGSLTIGTSAATGSIGTTAGSHTISTGLALGRNTSVSTASGTKLTLSGGLTGSNTLTKTGPGELVISGTGSLSGGTTVSAGTLRVTGAIASSAITVQSGATLGGTGTVGGTTIQSGGTLSPGNSPGTISVSGNAVWQPGGDYNWQIHDAAATAGTGWDLTSIAGDLDLTGLDASNRFDINLWSLSATGPDVNGNAVNFSPSQPSTWTIARVTGGGSILGFSADKFNLNLAAANGTGGFTNFLDGGTISIVQSGSDLNLVFAVPEPGSLVLAAAGLAAALAARRRRGVRPAR